MIINTFKLSNYRIRTYRLILSPRHHSPTYFSFIPLDKYIYMSSDESQKNRLLGAAFGQRAVCWTVLT